MVSLEPVVLQARLEILDLLVSRVRAAHLADREILVPLGQSEVPDLQDYQAALDNPASKDLLDYQDQLADLEQLE